jgi:hypothetical protein
MPVRVEFSFQQPPVILFFPKCSFILFSNISFRDCRNSKINGENIYFLLKIIPDFCPFIVHHHGAEHIGLKFSPDVLVVIMFTNPDDSVQCGSQYEFKIPWHIHSFSVLSILITALSIRGRQTNDKLQLLVPSFLFISRRIQSNFP